MKKIKKYMGWMVCSVLSWSFLTGAAGILVLAEQENQRERKTLEDGSTDINSLLEAIRVVDIAELFTERDRETGYKQNESSSIIFDHTDIQCSSNAAVVDGATVTITEEGTYILRGTLDDGQIIVDVDKTEKVQLVLDNVSITSSDSAAIYIKKADKVFVTMTAGSENLIAASGEDEVIDDNNIDAAIFSKEDVTFNGSGTLNVQSAYGHGIVSKDDLKVTEGTYEIEAAGHGLSGKDSVRILDGTFSITAGKDGIHAENSDDELLGYIAIEGGNFEITAEGDGMDAASILQIDSGTIYVNAGGGSENGELHTEDGMGGRGKEWFNRDAASEEEAAAASQKGLKAGEALLLNDGEITIDSADDSMHTNGDLVMQGGIVQLTTGDDGIHADNHVIILDGTIDVIECYEGIEGNAIDICGGDITLKASDDGLNAAGGNDQSGVWGFGGMDPFAAAEGVYICISDGTIDINADGDGIDSNGNLYVTGGETLVCGPSDSANGALDYNGEAKVTGGIVVAVGPSGMAQTFTSAENQGVIFITASNQSAGSMVTLTDSEEIKILEFTPEKNYSAVVITCPEIQDGKTYTVTAGETAEEITMDGLLYGSGNGMFGSGDGQRDGFMHEGDRKQDFQDGQKGNKKIGPSEDFEPMSMEEPPEGFDPSQMMPGKMPEDREEFHAEN